MSPSRRREAVCMLQERFDLSERRACRISGQHRSTQRRVPTRGRGDDALRTELRAFSRGHSRWGYRRAWATLRDGGWTVNRKRVQRLWREEGLRVPAKRRKRQRLGDSTVPAERLRAERPNHVWALDFQFDQTADGRVLKLLNVVDEYTREALAMVAARGITADATVEALERIVAERGTAPACIRCDNGPELTANALRDWCAAPCGQQLHRPRSAVGEPVRRVVQRPAARRAPGRRAVRHPARGAGADRGLADRVQHEAPAQQPGLARPGYLRGALEDGAAGRTLIRGGLANGVRSAEVNINEQTVSRSSRQHTKVS